MFEIGEWWSRILISETSEMGEWWSQILIYGMFEIGEWWSQILISGTSEIGEWWSQILISGTSEIGEWWSQILISGTSEIGEWWSQILISGMFSLLASLLFHRLCRKATSVYSLSILFATDRAVQWCVVWLCVHTSHAFSFYSAEFSHFLSLCCSSVVD